MKSEPWRGRRETSRLWGVGQSTCLAACGMVELERRKSRNGCKPHAWFYNMGACVNATPLRLVCWWTNRFRSSDSVRQRLHGLCARAINAVSAISREGRERVSAGGFESSAQTASRKGRTFGGSCILETEISPSILDCMWRKMRGHISMLQPHMIAVKLGRMGALSLPAGMGLWERPATRAALSQSCHLGEEEADTVFCSWSCGAPYPCTVTI